MKLDEKGLKELHTREGLKLKPYLDTKGIPTIAMGNTFYLDGTKVTMKDKPLTLKEALELSKKVVERFETAVNSAVKVKLNQNQYNSCVSIMYNIGVTGFKSSTLLRLINKDPNDPKIYAAIMMWTKDKELIGRRTTEAKQYFKK
jgi:lysozyme